MGAIGWVDADTFYCHAERLRFPILRKRPLAVLGNNGACVIARTAEMKAAGVKVGDPVWESKILCPRGTYLKRDFAWLDEVSGRLLDTIRGVSDTVEYSSVDEMGFAAEARRGSFLQTAATVRGRVMQEVGVPVTVGIASTRTLAKLLCDQSKPFGAAVALGRREEETLLARFSVADLSGIGPSRARTLAAYGIYDCLQFARADRRLIRRLLTVAGEALWFEANGDSVLPLRTGRPKHQVFSRGGSLGRRVSDPRQLWGWMVRNLERLVEEFRFHEQKAGRVSLYVCYQEDKERHGFVRGGRSTVVPPSDRFDFLVEHYAACLRAAYVKGAVATRMHLVAEHLTPSWEIQLSLFDAPQARADVADALKEAVNARHGRFALRSAATLALPEIYADPATYHEICEVGRGRGGKFHF